MCIYQGAHPKRLAEARQYFEERGLKDGTKFQPMDDFQDPLKAQQSQGVSEGEGKQQKFDLSVDPRQDRGGEEEKNQEE